MLHLLSFANIRNYLFTSKQNAQKKYHKVAKNQKRPGKESIFSEAFGCSCHVPVPWHVCHVPVPCHGCQGGGSHFSISTSVNGSYLPFFISRMHVPLSRACTVCHMPIGILTATFSPPGSKTNESVQIRSSSS